jgi:methyl-accepting chemotaxis protein
VAIVANWWNSLGLRLKLQILIQGFLILVLLAAQQWVLVQFEKQVLHGATDRAQAVADGAINGLNTLMVTKIGTEDVISNKASRALFIEKMGISERLKEMRVIRHKAMDDEFPSPMPSELPVDEVDRDVLATGKTMHKFITAPNGDVSLRTVVPFLNLKSFRGNSCVKCHGQPEGSVLGAASIVVDVNQEMALIRKVNTFMWIGQGLLQVILFIVVGMIVRRLLAQLGGEPQQVIDIVKHIAKGNLANDIATKPGDDHSLLAAMKQMQIGLREMLSGTRQTAEALERAAQHLTNSSSQVLSAAERQSEASTSVASSVEEMTVCISHISENAADAQKHASETGSLATDGSNVVKEVIVEMDKIHNAVNDSSELISTLGQKSMQISDIVKVIKEIADQTNLLALNAAIEAARAGEHGRGFAVVADEVRKLSERTTLSTQEIASMIDTIQSGTNEAVEGMSVGRARVNEGVEMVGRAGSSMDKIQGGVQNVLASVDEISNSLREQSAARNLIARNVEGIAQMTEETSSIIKEVSASAEHLEQLSRTLNQAVGQFKL